MKDNHGYCGRRPPQHPLHIGEIKYSAQQINDLLDMIPKKADRKEILGLKAGFAPDEEDLTAVEVETSAVVKFKDRDTTKGKGYIILRTENSLVEQMVQENTIYEVRYDFDLGGETLEVPANCVLEFKGGSFRNGTIQGDKTSIKNALDRIFESVRVDGTWVVSEVYSKWFDLNQAENHDNIQNFRNMMVLAASEIYTNIYIEEGVFYTSAWLESNGVYVDDIGISVPSNVCINNSATIKVIGNPHDKTSVFYVEGVKNVTIQGGKLVGDISTHTGATGEWGYGISLINSENVIIKDIELCEMWGDGIDINSPYMDYVNQVAEGHCKNILIDNVRCLNNRRQGISIEAVDGLTIRNSEFSGTGSILFTAPGAGIDIEPWHIHQVIHNITIENCKLFNNKATALLIHLPADFDQEHDIRIINCTSDKGLYTKNVNKLFVDGYVATGLYGHLALWSKLKDATIVNSTFTGELYFSGASENVLIDKCSFDMSDAAWSGFGVVFEGGEDKSYTNVVVQNSIIKANAKKTRLIYNYSASPSIHFYNNYIESTNPTVQPVVLGFGHFERNQLVMAGRSIQFSNSFGNSVSVKENTFIFYGYNDNLITFNDETSIASGSSYDYDFIANKFITSGYFTLFAGKASIVRNRFWVNVLDCDVSALVPHNWSYRNSVLSPGYNSKTLSVNPTLNIKAGECQKITVPYTRSLIRIKTTNYPVGHAVMYNTITDININNTEKNYTIFSQVTCPLYFSLGLTQYLPTFAVEISDDVVNIYIKDQTNNAFRFAIEVEYFGQTSYNNNPIKYSVVSAPSLTFNIKLTSLCIVDSLSLPSYISKHNGFKVLYNGKTLTYYNSNWLNSNGEVNT